MLAGLNLLLTERDLRREDVLSPRLARSSLRAAVCAMDVETAGSLGRPGASAVPRPRPFPILEAAPGPRCGHTLTTITGPDGDVNKARLVLFGAAWRLQGHC